MFFLLLSIFSRLSSFCRHELQSKGASAREAVTVVVYVTNKSNNPAMLRRDPQMVNQAVDFFFHDLLTSVTK